MIVIASSSGKIPQVEGVNSHTVMHCTFADVNESQNSIAKGKQKEIIPLSLKAKDFTVMRNYAINLFLIGEEEKFIYINGGLKDVLVEKTIESLLEINSGFIITKEDKIAGFILPKEDVKILGGHNFLSQILIKKDDEASDDSSLMLSNEAIDFEYLHRYIRYKELMAITEKKELELQQDILRLKKEYDKDPMFYRHKIEGAKVSEYYMLYMNSVAAYRNQVRHSQEVLKEYSKVFKRIKRDSLSLRVKEAQRSFIQGFLYHKPLYSI